MSATESRVEVLAADRMVITRGDMRLEVAGCQVRAVLSWYRHMHDEHGEDVGRIYLAGVLAGMSLENMRQMQDMVGEVRERSRQAAELVAEAKARFGLS